MTAPCPRILVIEDELAIQRGLCDVLAYRGYAPTGVANGEEGLREGMRGGFDVCQALREHDARLPILMLTARGAEDDVLRGFRCGSDDYVTKPFSVGELMARVEALLRRAQRDDVLPAAFELGGWRVDPEQLVAFCETERIELSRREVEILALLLRERGRIVSRRRLLSDVWGMGSPERIETRTVDMHIAKLRKKLGADGRHLIETVRGEGYRLS